MREKRCEPKKLKLYADKTIPVDIIEALGRYFSIKSATEDGLSGHQNEDAYRRSKEKKSVLLTDKKDFWDDKKYPIEKYKGIIIIESSRGDTLEKVLCPFLRQYCIGHQWLYDVKAKISEIGFNIKGIATKGGRFETEYEYHGNQILERILIPEETSFEIIFQDHTSYCDKCRLREFFLPK